MRYLKCFVFFMLIFVCSSCVMDAVEAVEDLKTRGICVKKDETDKRWEFSSSIEKATKDGIVIYKTKEEGSGDYDKYENVSWVIEAELQERDGVLQPLYTLRTIYDKDGKQEVSFKKTFDYDNEKVYFQQRDENDEISKDKTFSIKGRITDNNTMTYFMGSFIENHDKEEYQKFYLVSSEPKLYKIKTKYIAQETLSLPIGKVDTIKLELIPQLGLLTGVSKMIVPPTFVWHDVKSPHAWYQYEGLETGLSSPTIVSHITEAVE